MAGVSWGDTGQGESAGASDASGGITVATQSWSMIASYHEGVQPEHVLMVMAKGKSVQLCISSFFKPLVSHHSSGQNKT